MPRDSWAFFANRAKKVIQNTNSMRSSRSSFRTELICSQGFVAQGMNFAVRTPSTPLNPDAMLAWGLLNQILSAQSRGYLGWRAQRQIKNGDNHAPELFSRVLE